MCVCAVLKLHIPLTTSQGDRNSYSSFFSSVWRGLCCECQVSLEPTFRPTVTDHELQMFRFPLLLKGTGRAPLFDITVNSPCGHVPGI